MHLSPCLLTLGLLTICCTGCPGKYRSDLDYSFSIANHWELSDLASGEIVQFESVVWHPDDSLQLRRFVMDQRVAAGRDVLEIGTRTGLIAILCLQHGANRVVATDHEPAAVANARYNAARLASDANLELVESAAHAADPFADVGRAERFGVIILNDRSLAEPGEPGAAERADEDEIDLCLERLTRHLQPGGRCFVYSHHPRRLRHWQTGAEQRGYEVRIHDERELEAMPDDFFPAMLLEINLATATRSAAP